jgi:hypothetical protein
MMSGLENFLACLLGVTKLRDLNREEVIGGVGVSLIAMAETFQMI